MSENNFKEDITKLQEEFNKSIAFFEDFVRSNIPGNVDVKMISETKVERDAGKVPLKQLASLASTSGHSLSATPFNSSDLKSIEKALQNLNMGGVRIEGNSVLLTLPPITQEYTKKLIVRVKAQLETTKVAIREARRKYLDSIKSLKKTREDAFKKQEKEVQKVLDTATAKCDTIYKDFEKKHG